MAVDATYYLGQLLDNPDGHEPLLPALGGLTGIEIHINESLELWEKHKITPFFIFDGQSIVGQDDLTLRRGRAANQKTEQAWTLYSESRAEDAVSTFGHNPGTSGCLNKQILQLIQDIQAPTACRTCTLCFRRFSKTEACIS